MHRKKIFTLFLITPLLLVLLPANAAQQIKDGSTCSKKGAITRVSSTQYVCTLKNKKLIWVKSPAKVINNKEQSKLENESSKSPSPIPTPQPYAKVDSISRDIYLKLDAMSLDLYSKLNSKDSDITIEFENPNDSFSTGVMETTKLGFKLLRIIYPSLPSQNVYFYENVNWVESRVMPICPRTMEWVRQYGQANAGCGVLFVADLPIFHKFGFEVAKNIATHEMFHNVTIKAEAEVPENQRKFGQVASWFTEGMAQITSGWTRALYKDSKNPHYGELEWQDNWKQKDCQNALNLWKSGNINANHEQTMNCEYGLGRLMSEILIAKSGSYAPVLDMHRDRYQGVPFEQSLEKRFGISNAEFFKLVDQRLKALGWSNF